MSLDVPDRANQILNAQRARRPRWYGSTAKSTPSWFTGGELDLLAASERDKLFLEVRGHDKPSWDVLILLAAINAPGMVKSMSSDTHRALWISVAVGYVVIAIGAWLARRRRILMSARKRVRDSDNWPLVALQHTR